MRLEHPAGVLALATLAAIVPELVGVWLAAALLSCTVRHMLATMREQPGPGLIVPRHVSDDAFTSTALVFVAVLAAPALVHAPI